METWRKRTKKYKSKDFTRQETPIKMTQTTIFAAIDNLELNNESWLRWARSAAKTLSLMRGSVTSDDVREKADLYGLQPDSPKSWGCLFKCKGWRWVGREPSRIVSNNKRWINRYKWEG